LLAASRTVYYMLQKEVPTLNNLIGHRGIGRGEVFYKNRLVKENTLDSFIAALELGINFIETDIVRTIDDRLVLYHDTIILDNTPISAISEKEARSLGLTTLQELFDNTPPTVSIIAEVKHIAKDFGNSSNSTALLAQRSIFDESSATFRHIATYGFDISTALSMKNLPKTVSKGLILEGGSDFTGLLISAKYFGFEYAAAHTSTLLGDRAINQMRPLDLASLSLLAKKSGIKVIAWTPTFLESIELFAKGIDYLCVDNIPQFIDDLNHYTTYKK
jgi:glycerophosphoryl diester phosphodiesterase